MSRLGCPQCKAELRPRDVDFVNLQARCRACGWALGGSGRGPYRLGPATGTEEEEAGPLVGITDVPRPHNVDLDEQRLLGDRRRLRVVVTGGFGRLRYIRWVSFGLCAAGLIGMMSSQRALILLSAGLLYYVLVTLGRLLERTTIEVTERGRFRAIRRVLPEKGKVDVETEAVDQLWVQESRQYAGYDLMVRHGGTKPLVLGGMDDLQLAFYLEEVIERFLSLDQEAVEGELQRPELPRAPVAHKLEAFPSRPPEARWKRPETVPDHTEGDASG